MVTGASGFVGPHLCAHLGACGDDVFLSAAEVTDAEALTAEFAQARPVVVYHLAAQSDVAASWHDPATTLRVNCEGTLNVLRAAQRAGARRVVVASSADVYGRVRPEDLPVAENTPMAPVTPYGASKAAAEIMCIQAQAAAEVEVIRARAFNHIGPGQSRRFVAAALAAQVAANERNGGNEVRVGNLEARRDFTDVRDVVRAYRLLAVSGVPGEAYNVCTGTARSVSQLAAMLLEAANHRMRLVNDAALVRPVDVPEIRGDPTRIAETVGWRPEIPLERTIRDLLAHWRCETEPVPTTAGPPHPHDQPGEDPPARDERNADASAPRGSGR